MNRSEKIYAILRDVVNVHAGRDPSITRLPEKIDRPSKLVDFGIDISTLPEIAADLKERLGGKTLKLDDLYVSEELNQCTFGQFIDLLEGSLTPDTEKNLVVYVDDEEENLFIFKRKFGKRLNLKTFTEPLKALDFVRENENVRLVITDEVMPKLSGNELCDEIHKTKPLMKFILITGNPNNDGDLMYRALRRNRFFEFINKPIDLEGKGEEYLSMIQGLIDFDW